MKTALKTILILLGLWTNLLGSAFLPCPEPGDCSPVAVEDCTDVVGHAHSHKHEQQKTDDCESEPVPEDPDTGSDDHHHCVKGPAAPLALPPLKASKTISLPSAGDRPLAVAPALPEAPVFSLEQPPQS